MSNFYRRTKGVSDLVLNIKTDVCYWVTGKKGLLNEKNNNNTLFRNGSDDQESRQKTVTGVSQEPFVMPDWGSNQHLKKVLLGVQNKMYIQRTTQEERNGRDTQWVNPTLEDLLLRGRSWS